MENKKNELKDELLSKTSGGKGVKSDPVEAWWNNYHNILRGRTKTRDMDIYLREFSNKCSLPGMLINYYPTIDSLKNDLREHGFYVDDLQ